MPRCTLIFLSSVAVRYPPPAAISPNRALSQLLKRKDVYEQFSVSGLASYKDGLVSLPISVDGAPWLTDILNDTDRATLEDLHHRRREVKSADDSQSSAPAYMSVDEVPYYVDAVFRKTPRMYAKFIRLLEKIGLIRYVKFAVTNAGIFFVKKKDGRLRMVIDARRANFLLPDVHHIQLCTSEGLTRFECSGDDEMFYGGHRYLRLLSLNADISGTWKIVWIATC